MKPDPEKSEEDADADEEVSTADMMESCSHLKNERSDDYQEQIGMPDEENMRSWSHHYKTDTVDDPIFRAAMRGYDTVSFIFGLEVTWGKIQQRQQEEEDLEAMKELEHMDELQNLQEDLEDGNEAAKDSENTEDVGDGKANDQPMVEVVETQDAMEVEDAAAIVATDNDDDDDNDDDESVQVAEEVLASSPSGSDSPEIDADREGGTPEAQIIESPSSDGSSSPTAVEVLSVENDDSPQQHQATPTKKNTWVCQRCTMENAMPKRKCEACKSNRSPVSSKSRS